jgi:hypothetical protein
MSNGAAVASSGAAAAGAAAATANAIKASGVIVRVEPREFIRIIEKQDAPLVVYAAAGFFTSHRYLVSYKGLAFFTKSPEILQLPGSCELVTAKTIWIPG